MSEEKKGMYRVVTGRPGRPKRYATLEEIPQELKDKYQIVFEDHDEKNLPLAPKETFDEEFEAGDTAGQSVEDENTAELAAEALLASKRRRPKRVRTEMIAMGEDRIRGTGEFESGDPIEGESHADFGVGRPMTQAAFEVRVVEGSARKRRARSVREDEDSEDSEDSHGSRPAVHGTGLEEADEFASEFETDDPVDFVKPRRGHSAALEAAHEFASEFETDDPATEDPDAECEQSFEQEEEPEPGQECQQEFGEEPEAAPKSPARLRRKAGTVRAAVLKEEAPKAGFEPDEECQQSFEAPEEGRTVEAPCGKVRITRTRRLPRDARPSKKEEEESEEDTSADCPRVQRTQPKEENPNAQIYAKALLGQAGMDLVETPSECTPEDVSVQSPCGDVGYLRGRSNEELRNLAKERGIEGATELRRQELIFQIMRSEYASRGFRLVRGLVDIAQVKGKRCGFLRMSERNYEPCDYDFYISPSQVVRFKLEKGDLVYGVTRRKRLGEKCEPIIQVVSVNAMLPSSKEGRTSFEDLTPEFAAQRYLLEYAPDNLSTRVLDLISPIGKGQRGLIVAPPRAGKTMLLKDIANALAHNAPGAELIVLLIDERPEEVTDMERTVKGEVISSTFDEPAERHIQVAEIVLEKAKRLVESGRDVIILLDSITRLARAYNSSQKNSGKTMTGGIDASALQKPKRFFGAARSIEDGGSLTIIATALVETGSRMDDLIFEEFKGTGNMECVLDRRIGEKRIFPAIDIDRSGTRKEELLFDKKELEKVWLLRQNLANLNPQAKIEKLLDMMRATSSNAELLMTIKER